MKLKNNHTKQMQENTGTCCFGGISSSKYVLNCDGLVGHFLDSNHSSASWG